MIFCFLIYSDDTRTMKTWYLFVHFFSDYRMRAHTCVKSIQCFYTYKIGYMRNTIHHKKSLYSLVIPKKCTQKYQVFTVWVSSYCRIVGTKLLFIFKLKRGKENNWVVLVELNRAYQKSALGPKKELIFNIGGIRNNVQMLVGKSEIVMSKLWKAIQFCLKQWVCDGSTFCFNSPRPPPGTQSTPTQEFVGINSGSFNSVVSTKATLIIFFFCYRWHRIPQRKIKICLAGKPHLYSRLAISLVQHYKRQRNSQQKRTLKNQHNNQLSVQVIIKQTTAAATQQIDKDKN